ncbi:MAG: EAL domain-containing protein [Treponema sp.]|nr:EAL domain-containing protein [Treponema sp.]
MHDFMEIFNKYSIPAKMIQLEILERSIMDNSTMQDITNKLHKEGFSVAMDDFGSGESSLNMLTKIPVDVLKFDREFLNASTDRNGHIDKKSEKFIHILIDLSKNLDKQTVFEGVETQAQRDFLRSINCDQAQGFFYSEPLSEQDFLEFLKRHS